MKNATSIRANNPSRNFALILTLCLFVVSPLAQHWGWCKDPDRGITLWGDADGKNTQLSYLELVKLLNDNLKDAQQVNIYVDLCHSGAFLEEAKNLTMPYFVAVGEKDAAKCTYSNSVKTDEKPPGRLTISPPYNKDLEDPFSYSFADYLTKRLKQTKEIATAKSLFEAASEDVKEDTGLSKHGQTPGSGFGNEAKLELAINGGDKSNHALIFDGWHITSDQKEPALELYRALAKAKYKFKKDGNSLQFYFDLSDKEELEGTSIDGSGTLANLKVALQNLQNLVKKNPKEELVNIFFNGDGYQAAAAAPRQPGLDGMPKDGFLVLGRTTGLVVPTDLSFWHDLKVGIVPNDEDLVRAHPAKFVLYVSEASMSYPVAVAINDLPLGYFYLSSTSTGGELEVSLPDSFTKALIAEADGAPSINVTMALTPGDYLRIATEDDILLDPAYSQGDYGFGIATTVIGMDPQ